MAKQKVDLDVIYDEMDEDDELRRRDVQTLLKAHQRLVLFEQKWDLNSDIVKIPTVCRSIILDFIEAREFIRERLLTIKSEKLDLTGRRNFFSDDCDSAVRELKKFSTEFKEGLEYLIYQVNKDPGSYHDYADYGSIDKAFERHIIKKKKAGISIPEDLRHRLFSSEEDFQKLLPHCHYSLYALPPMAPKNFKFSYSQSQKVSSASRLIIDLNDNIFIFNGIPLKADEKKIHALAKLKELTDNSDARGVRSKEVSEVDLKTAFNSGYSKKSPFIQIFKNHVHSEKVANNVWYRIKGDVTVIYKNKP